MKEFEQIYAEYYEPVYRYALQLCRNETLAEELTQETFFKALRSIHSFRGECKLSVWLCQIVKNTYSTYAAKQQKRLEMPQDISAPTDDIIQRLEDQETAYKLHCLLHRLDEPYKEIFWMRTFGELSFREIARIFGRSESWARVIYHRAKVKLKEELL